MVSLELFSADLLLVVVVVVGLLVLAADARRTHACSRSSNCAVRAHRACFASCTAAAVQEFVFLARPTIPSPVCLAARPAATAVARVAVA